MRRRSLSVKVLLDVEDECDLLGATEVEIVGSGMVLERGKMGLCSGTIDGGLFSEGFVI